jgi:hypothetical protein
VSARDAFEDGAGLAFAATERVQRETAALERDHLDVEVELVDMRANVYTVRDDAIAEMWVFEADQYAVDELFG